MRSTSITAIAHAIPTRELTYEELEERLGKKEVKTIFKMSGIRNRRVVEEGQCASDLAYAAAKRLIEKKNIDPKTIDLLTFASQTPDYRIPATASVLQGRLGLSEECCTFDINQACSSFCHSIKIAHSMIVAGQAKRALVLNGDALSTLINPRDRGLVTLHGDAGTAALIEPVEEEGAGIEEIQIGTDGTKFDKLLVPAGGARMPHSKDTAIDIEDENHCFRNLDQIYMDGPSIFHFSIYKITDVIKDFLNKKNKKIDDFDTILLHQANKTMVKLIYKSIGATKGQQFFYCENIGNCSGASLPSLLSQAWQEGVVRPGTRTLMCAFGGGLAWGLVSIKWPVDANAAIPGDVDTPHRPVIEELNETV